MVALFLIVPLRLSAQDVGQGLGTTTLIPEEELTKKEVKKEVKLEAEAVMSSNVVERLLESMSLEEKLAQLMFVRVNGELALTTMDTNMLKHLPPGGVMVPELSSSRTMMDYARTIYQMAGKTKNPVPFFIAGDAFTHLDTDTKNINRFLKMPTRLAMGAAGNSDDRAELFDILADDLSRIGINTHFGPSLAMANALQLDSNSIYTFGNNPKMTADIAHQLGRAFKKHNVLWCPQGFPGGGANRMDGGEPVLIGANNSYLERDGYPYLAALQTGISMMHVGNTLVKDEEGYMLPASISSNTITTLLKGSLGFEGLVIAGPMDSLGMLNKYNPEEASLQSLRSGADMLLWGSSSAQIYKTIAYINQEVVQGRVSETLIDQAVARVLVAKQKAGLFNPESLTENKDIEKIDRENRKSSASLNVERRSLTLLKNNQLILPLSKERSTPLFITGVIDLKPIKTALEKDLKHIRHFEIKSAKYLMRIQDFELRRLNSVAKGCRTALCIFDNRIDSRSQSLVITHLKEKKMKVVVFLLAPPEDINLYQYADSIILGYSDPNMIGPTISAMVDIVLGNAPIELVADDESTQIMVYEQMIFNVLDVIRTPTGKLPLHLEPSYAAGHSVSYLPQTIKSVEWDFGNGKGAKGNVVTHIYTEPGTYTTSVKVKHEDGSVVSKNYILQVKSLQASQQIFTE